MAPITSCDHCGRTGVTLGVYYPGRDISKPPVRLCQTYQGTPITPNCYHLVTELGEQLGIRKVNAIMETDRHAPRVEAVALRFQDSAQGNVILTETERPGDAPAPPRMSYGEVLSGDHPRHGERIPMQPPEIPADSVTTKAEEAKGIINPHGADQRPLVDPASAEGQAIADAAAQAEVRKIQLPGGFGGIGGVAEVSGDPERGFSGGTVPKRYPHGPVGEHHSDEFPAPPQPISPDDMVRTGGPAPGPTVNTSGAVVDSAPPVDPDAKTPAQVAAEAQAKVDAEEAEKEAKKAPAKKAAKKAAPSAEKKPQVQDVPPPEEKDTLPAPETEVPAKVAEQESEAGA